MFVLFTTETHLLPTYNVVVFSIIQTLMLLSIAARHYFPYQFMPQISKADETR